jgi:hypothetical protein
MLRKHQYALRFVGSRVEYEAMGKRPLRLKPPISGFIGKAYEGRFGSFRWPNDSGFSGLWIRLQTAGIMTVANLTLGNLHRC